ncbi:MAG TPA: hypothetical protein VLY86_00285 [Methanothrix sp.]|nr:hypothetical protein [Methanothrix sp.]
MSKIATGLVLFSLLMALSFGVAFAESQTANATSSMNNTSAMEPVNNSTSMPANNTTVEMPANNTTVAGK